MGWNFVKIAENAAKAAKAVGKGGVKAMEGTGKTLGTAAKGVGEGLGATARGLGGWKGVVGTGAVIGAVSSENGLTGVASDVLFGKNGSEKIQEHGLAGEAVNIAIGDQGKQAISDASSVVADKVADVGQKVQSFDYHKFYGSFAGDNAQSSPTVQQDGFGNFMSQATTNPFGMGGNFLNNMMNGNVSSMSMAAMIASSLMIFGRFGWFAKAMGALLGMHTIGRNSHPMYVPQAQAAPGQGILQPSSSPVPQMDMEVVERSRGLGR